MLPPVLIRRLVLAPLVIVTACGFIVLSPFLALLALVFGLLARSRAARLTRPVIVLSRHAGPGDSLLLVHQLLSVYHRRPRVVMKATLQLDPSVDIVGNRLPNVWIKSRQAGEHIFTEQIARLARGLDERGALVIFPEGGNWTPGRWRRGIRRLEHLGRPDLAERA